MLGSRTGPAAILTPAGAERHCRPDPMHTDAMPAPATAPATVALVGPTASGKTALALALARSRRLGRRSAEIVNADSMLVYRGMDIGTAKPSPAERAAVRHHLIDIWDVRRTATVAEFQGLARAAIADCGTRGVLPLLVGGSSLYIRAILDDFSFPGTDPAIRARLEADLAEAGPVELHRRLARLDPDAAAGIEPGNGRRIVRALEVVEMTGHYSSTLPGFRYALPGVVQIGLALDREVLDARIAERVDAMFAAGLVEEVRTLAGAGLREGRTASRALGYRQVLDYLDGRIDEATARERTITATRRFARKQLGWFRRDPRIVWVDATRAPDELADRLWAGPLSGVVS